ncbi:GntR family transcriptional regulator [Nosocomiicoccus massiliensis]|uniref:GntR family transcriptional regulator n=1 Tax=Nosocomiicoccus massiliensis TaxID=1232430 RepID=UPI000405DC2D|nr:GntR family transcriptional regulator [Nosocomiicoccus massiliensis]
MDILIDNTSKTPIYEQIVNQIKESIMHGELNEGDALPSMRKLAKDLKVSVITTKRAYEELENEGYTYSVVGKGSFVKEQNLEQIRERKLKLLEEMIDDVIQNSKSVNLSKDELFELINILYEE